MTLTPTQADRDAAKVIEWVRTTIDDQNAIAEAFAAHREAGELAGVRLLLLIGIIRHSIPRRTATNNLAFFA